MFVDADDVKKCRHQSVDVEKLQLPPIGLAHRHPVENAAGCGEVHPGRARRDWHAVLAHKHAHAAVPIAPLET